MQESVLPCTMHMHKFHSTITDTAPVTAGKHCLPDNIADKAKRRNTIVIIVEVPSFYHNIECW